MRKKLLAAGFIFMLFSLASAAANFVKPAQANPYRRDFKFTEVSPPAGTQPPSVIIHTPQNGSFYPKNFNLTFDVNIPETDGDKSISAVAKLYYEASWEPKEIIISEGGFGESTSFSIDLSDVRGGNHSITIFAEGYGSYKVSEEFIDPVTIFYSYESFRLTGVSNVFFTKDVVSPRISFLSPQNRTYVTSDVELDLVVSETTSEILYSLDGKENQTMTKNVTLIDLQNGAHNVTFYAADLAGNAAVPKTLFFSVNVPEPFPVVPVASASVTSVAVLSAGLLFYFNKRKR